jgi:DNA-binding transcriptional ArsR family regulator
MPVRTLGSGDVDRRLVKALSHPLRVRVLQVLSERVASPNEIAKELDAPLGNVSYHARILLEHDCIELVDTQPRRGAIEHYYRATVRPWLDEASWKALPAGLRRQLAGQTLQDLWADAREAGRRGAFDRSDAYVTRTLLDVDERGWEELTELMGATLERALEIQGQSAARRPEQTIPTELGLLFFARP